MKAMKFSSSKKVKDISMAKLPKEIKEKWLKALRGGRYRQGTGQLKNEMNGSYCCLGVLCQVVNPKFLSRYEGDMMTSCIPEPIAEKLGIERDSLSRFA